MTNWENPVSFHHKRELRKKKGAPSLLSKISKNHLTNDHKKKVKKRWTSLHVVWALWMLKVALHRWLPYLQNIYQLGVFEQVIRDVDFNYMSLLLLSYWACLTNSWNLLSCRFFLKTSVGVGVQLEEILKSHWISFG